MSKVRSIGLITEDNSDFDSFKTIISRIIGKENLNFKKAIGFGCGKMKRKALSYAELLHSKGCNMIILVHDLDRNNLTELTVELNEILKGSPAQHNFVCIPIEELEGWFLSDPQGIRDNLGLNRIPNIPGNPETIKSPKEKLGEIIYQCSNKAKIYLNTRHNAQLAQTISIEKMKNKCQSFELFHDFIISKNY